MARLDASYRDRDGSVTYSRGTTSERLRKWRRAIPDLGGPDALHLAQQPVLGRVKTLHVLLGAATLHDKGNGVQHKQHAAGRGGVERNIIMLSAGLYISTHSTAGGTETTGC